MRFGKDGAHGSLRNSIVFNYESEEQNMKINHKNIGRLLSLLLTLCMVLGVAPGAVFAVEPLSTEVVINETNFPDENFREHIKMYDWDHNGTLSAEEIASLESIDVDQSEIKSLQGVEFFKNLKYLSCSQNQLTTLDVSHNLNLEILICGDNRLTSLDVSKNVALLQLNCAMNMITSLDVSHNTELRSFCCAFNKLKTVDLSQNVKLEQLICGCNQLTELDLSKNTALKEVECSVNWLSSLDISHNKELQELACLNNKLTSLDVSKNPSLISLHCTANELSALDLSKNENLELLDCFQNELVTLDLSKNPKLNFLDCGKNSLTSLDLGNNNNVRVIRCDYNMYVIPEREGFDYTALPGDFDIDKVSDVFGGQFHRENHIFTMDPDVMKAGYSYEVKPNERATFEFYHNPFEDLEQGTYYYNPVIWAAGNGITDGVTATTFTPQRNCTRGQVMTFFWRIAGCPEPKTTDSPFVDVQDPSRFYYKAVLWAMENDITTGITPEQFKPNSTCTRGQVVTFLWRLTGEVEHLATVSRFDDVQNTESYYYDAVLWATEEFITTGVQPGIFKPEATCNRAQILTFIYRCLM